MVHRLTSGVPHRPAARAFALLAAVGMSLPLAGHAQQSPPQLPFAQLGAEDLIECMGTAQLLIAVTGQDPAFAETRARMAEFAYVLSLRYGAVTECAIPRADMQDQVRLSAQSQLQDFGENVVNAPPIQEVLQNWARIVFECAASVGEQRMVDLAQAAEDGEAECGWN